MSGNASTRPGFDPQRVGELLEHLLDLFPANRSGMLLGLSALQGSGKSTLAAQLARASSAGGLPAVVVSLDDFYLGRRDRWKLARQVHPLLRTRGVPGTHDIVLLESVLAALRATSDGSTVRVPGFDKGRDTRLAPSHWRRVRKPARLIILEGWCVGLDAEEEQALVEPVNELERAEDADGRWRRWVNLQLAEGYRNLWQKLDRLLVLQAPGFGVVTDWRDEQEASLRERGARHAMSATAIGRFVAHTERLGRHALASLPAKADLVVELGARREFGSIKRPLRPAA